jgi:glycerol uptake facilitator protein
VAAIGASAGYLEAWPISPARDFGPRLFCFLNGWGAQACQRREPPGGCRLRRCWAAWRAAAAFAIRPFLSPAGGVRS